MGKAYTIPGVKIIGTEGSFQYPDQVWSREMVHQYLPALEVNNQSLREFLQHAGYGQSVCGDSDERCEGLGTTAIWPCQMASSLRKRSRILLGFPFAAFLFYCSIGLPYLLRQHKWFKQEKTKIE